MKNQAEKKLHEIAALLFDHIENGRILEAYGTGLYSGKAGVLLFLAHYLKDHPNERNRSLFEKYADSLYDDIGEGRQFHTYCNGMAGIMAGLRYMQGHGLLEVDYSEIESTYRDYLFAWMMQEFSHGYYDFMHGAMGIALYFYDDPMFVEAAVTWLENTKEVDGDKYKWKSSLGKDQPIGYNIALSHGMASIVLILCRMYRAGHFQERIADLITGTLNYILSQEMDHAQYGGCFPPQSLENEGRPPTKARVAWCYGDAGISAALWQAGKALGNEKWKQKAREVMTFTASRRNLADAMVNDAGLCHGSAGIAMMFKYFYFETGDPLFLQTHDYWMETALQMARFPEGFAGYMLFRHEEPHWLAAHGLLEGVAGIGLMFWSVGRNPEENRWTDLFLL